MRKLAGLMLTLTVLLAAWAPLHAQEAAESSEDIWYAQFQGGKKTGWTHERRARTKRDGKTVWVTESETSVVRGPDGNTMERPFRMSSRFVEDEAGAVLEYATSVDLGMPSGPQTRKGTVVNGVVTAVEDGKSREVPYPDGAVGPAAVARAMCAKPGKDATGSVVAFQAIDATADTVSWKYPSIGTLESILGRYIWLDVVEKKDGTGMPETLLLGRETTVPWGGAINFGTIRFFRTEEAVAKADAMPSSLITSRIVAPDRAVPNAGRIVLRLRRKEGTIDLPESRGQRIVARGKDGSVDVELNGAEPAEGTSKYARPYQGEEDLEPFLAATAIVEIGNARLARFAKAIVGELDDPLDCARLIELRSRRYVRPSPADVGFGTACDAISGGTGDSTEVSLLAAAYARAVGLPSRLVSGFLYWDAAGWPGGKYPKGAFAPHVWAEVYIGGGVWHPIDPFRARGEEPKERVSELVGKGGFDATHVAVLRSDLNTEQPFTDIVLPVLTFLDGLTIEVVEPAK